MKDKQLIRSENDFWEGSYLDLVELLENRAKILPNKTIYHFLEDGEKETSSLTYAQMHELCIRIAVNLQKLRIGKNDKLCLLFPSGIDFILSLWGCILNGSIGVPTYSPRKNRNNERFWSVLHNSQSIAIVIPKSLLGYFNKAVGNDDRLMDVRIILYEDLLADNDNEWVKPEINPDDIAFLQYTSGSTSVPKGVMVSHKNLLYNSEVIRQSFNHTENLVGVNWLPPFHDMGLIGTLFQPLYVGGMNIIIPPNVFLRDPFLWLKTISTYRGTTVGGPNFSLDYCIEKIDEAQLEELDLSSIDIFFCGAEPVNADTLKRFYKKFKKTGFKYSAFYPCYGLAESTLMVSGGKYDEPPVFLEDEMKKNIQVGCGFPWVGTSICIVDPESRVIQNEGEVGEIWTSGPSVCQGYYNKEKETEEVFRAYTSDTHEGPFMRTGDLGFIHEGQLYVSGRLKDMIIIRGQNYYPQDIEKVTEESHPALRKYANAVFSVDAAGEERLVVVQEVERTHMRDLNEEEVFAAIRDAVASEFELSVHHIVLIRTGSILKTTSGKIMRRASKKAYLENELNIVASSELDLTVVYEEVPFGTDTKSIEKWLVYWISRKAKIPAEEIDTNKSILSYGLDSIAMVELEREVNKQFGIEIELTDFMEKNKIREIVELGERMLIPRLRSG